MNEIDLILERLTRSSAMPRLGSRIVGDTPGGRPAYLNSDGSISTARSVTEKHPRMNGGAWTNVPTIFGGRQMPPGEAVEYVLANQPEPRSLQDMLRVVDPVTGETLHAHKTIQDAVSAAQNKSRATRINPRPPYRSFWEDGIR